ncbi:MAG: STAS domain-containing protein [Halanaerobiales bacterium]
MSDKKNALVLPEELSLFTADEYRSGLIKDIADKTPESLDASMLKIMDAAGIQLLLSLQKSFPELKIENIPEKLIVDFELMGLTELFDIQG